MPRELRIGPMPRELRIRWESDAASCTSYIPVIDLLDCTTVEAAMSEIDAAVQFDFEQQVLPSYDFAGVREQVAALLAEAEAAADTIHTS